MEVCKYHTFIRKYTEKTSTWGIVYYFSQDYKYIHLNWELSNNLSDTPVEFREGGLISSRQKITLSFIYSLRIYFKGNNDSLWFIY